MARALCVVQLYATLALSHSGVSPKLTVHMTPHTHADTGWLKTVDQCYMGSNNTIQHAAVQYILDSVVNSLLLHPERKFTWAEQAFFQRWWDEQGTRVRGAVRELVVSGQLQFVDGGWTQHDEGCTHFTEMIDQTTFGQEFLKREFNVTPTVAWHLDPFGHTSAQASLLGAEAGFSEFFFGRIDDFDRRQRIRDRSMEMVWRPSPSLGPSTEIFAGALAAAPYCTPSGLNFNGPEGTSDLDNPVQNDERLEDTNVKLFVDQVVRDAHTYANMSLGSHVMFMMGCDYMYDSAEVWYKNLDRLIDAVNADGRVVAQYSTPDIYAAAKHAESLSWTVKTVDQDFMPICQVQATGSPDTGHMYWSGYFTSRPALKYNISVFDFSEELKVSKTRLSEQVRSSGRFLQAARQLQVLASLPMRQFVSSDQAHSSGEPYRHWSAALATDLKPLQAAVGLLTHHDAVTGTERQHVADDYSRHLAAGMAPAISVVRNALTKLAGGDGGNFSLCEQLNASVCSTSAFLDGSTGLDVIAYNPIARRTVDWVRLPLHVHNSTNPTYQVKNARTQQIQLVQAVPAPTMAGHSQLTAFREQLPDGLLDAPMHLIFRAELPPMGAEMFIVTQHPATNRLTSAPDLESIDSGDVAATPDQNVVLENEHLRITFQHGKMSTIINKQDGATANVTQSWHAYFAQRSGPWMMSLHNPQDPLSQRPDATGRNASCAGGTSGDREDTSCIVRLTDFRTTVAGQQISQQFGSVDSWITQTIYLDKGSKSLEVEWTVGPIDVRDGLSREVFTRFATDIDSGESFSADSNGYESYKHTRNRRHNFELPPTEPIASNVVPVNGMIAIADNKTTLTVMNDRSQGGTSLQSGEIDIFVHRRLLGCDYCTDLNGHLVQADVESLNETTGFSWIGDDWTSTNRFQRHGSGLVVRGKHSLALTTPSNAGAAYRDHQERISNPLVLGLRPSSTLSASHSFFGNRHNVMDKTAQSKERIGQLGVPGVDSQLPRGLSVLTLELIAQKRLLLRIMNKFGQGEGGHSQINVTLSSVLPHVEIASVQELGLTANGPPASQRELRRWRSPGSVLPAHLPAVVDDKTIVALPPLKIRVFELQLV